MFLSVGDILQLSRLAADLYTKGWAVARDAPQDFRDLVHELLLLKDILFVIHSKVSRDPDSYGDPTRRVLQYCFDALSDFSSLVAKYEKLALSDRGHWFRRLQWSREQNSIRDCHNRLQKYQALLQLVLTPEGRTILSEEHYDYVNFFDNPKWHGSSFQGDEDHGIHRERAESSFSQSIRSKTIDSSQTLISPYPSPPAKYAGSSSLWSPGLNFSYGDADSAGLAPLWKTSTQVTGRSSVSDSQRSSDKSRANQLPTTRPSDASLEGRLRQMSLSSIGSDDFQTRSPTENTILQPLEISEQREQHHCPEESQAVYLRSANTVTSPTGADNFHLYSHWEDTTSENQAYADLLKSSWIVEELIRKRKVAGDLSKRQARKCVIDLLKALQTDLHRRQHEKYTRAVPDTLVLLKQDLCLLETFEQTVEAKENVPQAMDDLTTSHRWITIDKDHGGFADERVMFRCWVNAQIGQRHERSKSSNAPYVVLLWTKAGESEISISLFNQRDTLNLSRKLTAEDLEDWESLENGATALHLDFPSQPAEINFLATWHFEHFREGPKRFFNAVKGRDPRSGELTIFQIVLKSYRNTNTSLTPEASESKTEQRSFDSCELRVYEQMDETCWKTVRRIVVSSAADSKKLGSVSHWFPISNVRVQVEDCTATVSWSDCGHLEKKNQGNYNPYYSYVYRSDQPNQKIILVFRNSDDAQRFEDCILHLTEMPPQVRLASVIESSSAFQETRLYSLFDQDDPDRGYHGVVYSRKSPKTYHSSQVGYVYRDLDFTFEKGDATTITLHNVRTPHYLSNRHKMLAKPKEREGEPQFKEVTYLSQSLTLSFSCDEDAVKFLSGLTGWRLKFYRQCAKLVLTDTSRFRSSKKSYKNAEIHLWEKAAPEGTLTQLIARLNEEDKPWLTGRLDKSGGGLGLPSGGVAELEGLTVQLGKDLDIKHMKANAGEEEKSKSSWKLVITFKETGHSNDFMVKTGLITPFTQSIGLSLGRGSSVSRDFALKRTSMSIRRNSPASSWDQPSIGTNESKTASSRHSTDLQAQKISTSSDQPRSDTYEHPLRGHQVPLNSSASSEALGSETRKYNQELTPQLPLSFSTEDETIRNEADVTPVAIRPMPYPSIRDPDNKSTHSEPEYLSEPSAQSAGLSSTFWDQSAQSSFFSQSSVSDFQSAKPVPSSDALKRLSIDRSNKSPQYQMESTADKTLNDEEITKSVLQELNYKSTPQETDARSHLSFAVIPSSDSQDYRVAEPHLLEMYKQTYFARAENSVSGKSRKRSKSACLTCRRRRIRRGEERPTCSNCIKSKRDCGGYTPRIIFKDPLVTPRSSSKALNEEESRGIFPDEESADHVFIVDNIPSLKRSSAPSKSLDLHRLDLPSSPGPSRDAQTSFITDTSKAKKDSTLVGYVVNEGAITKPNPAILPSYGQSPNTKEDTSLSETSITSNFVKSVEDVTKSFEHPPNGLNFLHGAKNSNAVPQRENITVPEKGFKPQMIHMNELLHGPGQALSSAAAAVNPTAAQSLTNQHVSRSQIQESGGKSTTVESRCNDNSSNTIFSSPRILRSLVFRYLSVISGSLWPEPPVAPEKIRIRWTCSCGTNLFDDFIEIRPGAAEELRNVLHAPEHRGPGGSQSTSTTSSDPNQMSVAGASMNFEGGFASSSVEQPNNSEIPIYNPVPVNGRQSSTTIICDPESKWLLVCAQAWQRPTSLLHLNLCSTSSDQQLFTHLRQLYLQLKQTWWHRLSLQAMKSIRFIQFELHSKDLVDVRKFPDMPPQARNEDYLYQPCDLLPPIGENLMSHLFHHPHDADEKAITFLRSPKKRKQKLAVCPQMGINVGWGIHLVEGWAVTKICVVIFTIFLLSSLVFAIAWSVLQHDVQGAFSVAAYFVALAGLGTGTLQAYLHEQ